MNWELELGTILILGVMAIVLFVGWLPAKRRVLFATVVTLIATAMLIGAFYADGDYALAIALGLLAGAMELWHTVWRQRRKEKG